MAHQPTATTAIATIEFWSRQEPSERLLKRIDATRPRMFIRPPEAWAALRRRRPARRGSPRWMCRFELCRQTSSKSRPSLALAKWVQDNRALLRAAQREGMDVLAAVEVFNRYVLYSLPVHGETVAALDRFNVPLTICIQATSIS